eukprot:408135-Amphidinium_carterae.1
MARVGGQRTDGCSTAARIVNETCATKRTTRPVTSREGGCDIISVRSASDVELDSASSSSDSMAIIAPSPGALWEGQAPRRKEQRKREEKVMLDIRWVPAEGWSMDNGGVFVGSGHRVLADSLWSGHYMDAVDLNLPREVLAGRPLMVASDRDCKKAVELWNALGLQSAKGACLDFSQWASAWHKDIRSLSTSSDLCVQSLGRLFKHHLRCRPGDLGNFVRISRLFPHENSRQELLPIPVHALEAYHLDANSEAWLSLCLHAINYLYCGGERLISTACKYPPSLLDGQLKLIQRVQQSAQSWLSLGALDFGATLEEAHSADDYEPRVVSTTYPVTVAAIAPSLPQKAHACQVDVCGLVSEQTREWLDKVLRAVGTDFQLPRSAVFVNSQNEWDALIGEMFERGLVEPCQLDE